MAHVGRVVPIDLIEPRPREAIRAGVHQAVPVDDDDVVEAGGHADTFRLPNAGFAQARDDGSPSRYACTSLRL